jgi:Methyltransferase domain
VFGSRMMTRFGAISGGMPLYKFAGNRILTWTQNLLLGTKLTESHSGYRVYSVAALEQIPYRLNSNVFHFDTEIIIQLLNAGQRILELPIPTYYGLKKHCRVAVVDQFLPQDGLHTGVVVFTQDLDHEPRFDVRGYDYLLLLDVIEHLKSPERFLDRLRTQFDYSPRTVILTTPNIAFGIQRVMLLLGQFNYGKAGILDWTHTRLFTFRSLRHLLRDAGFRIKEIRGVPAPFPKVLGDGVLGRAAMAINQLLIRISKSMFSYQNFRHRRSDTGRRLHPGGGQTAARTSGTGGDGCDRHRHADRRRGNRAAPIGSKPLRTSGH